MTTQFQPNPDSGSIASKNIIDVSYSATDVSASFGENVTPESLKTNATGQKIVLRLTGQTTGSFMYYTPVYTEQISYTQWKTLDRTFSELSI